jgi:hypothetical protein
VRKKFTNSLSSYRSDNRLCALLELRKHSVTQSVGLGDKFLLAS